MSIYAPLQQSLVKTDQAEVTYSFEEIERLLGRRLPASARDTQIQRQWWANTETHSQARAWLKAGRKARLDVARNRVTFVRAATPVSDKPDRPEFALSSLARQTLAQTALEHGVSETEAMNLLLNEAVLARRRALLAWFDTHAVPSSTSSVDLIREDRDGR